MYLSEVIFHQFFIDGSVGYKKISEKISIRGELNDLSGKTNSHVMSAGIRSGWKTHLKKYRNIFNAIGFSEYTEN